ncbi:MULTISPECIES: ParB/RepB/Spo0J family partition protein [Trichocoleus]|uniref:ParB/RepB/Spo0J family partition protein n=1 Tax=Trichocoleus desertorum GB2-A4 TaxID=2933944 RepID=A0ABV0JDX7_9CYAN|nr:ParB/RepB/Spo0J family partition protein [Trichocoleus sp. FACHB-46]MBD1865179.1 ParB/RepB/Spo0J family partition protein [Trichocoleus sp. FACHB-46]
MARRKPLPEYQLNNVRLLDELPTQAGQSVAIDRIQLPQKQPRRYFDPDKMQQLVQSVQEHGILEPLLVRPLRNDKYELVAGERRLKAAQTVGLAEVPIVSKELSDREALQIALMENLQREDLNPVEETEAILELLAIAIEGDTTNVMSILNRANHAKNREQELEENVFLQFKTIQTVLSGIGRFTPESFRTSRLPLLNLPADILQALRQGKLEYTKARAIARIQDEQKRQEILEEAIAQNLSLAQIKERVASLKTASAESTSSTQHSLKSVLDNAYRLSKRSKVWNNSKKQKRLEKLLTELENLFSEAD